MKRRDLLFFLSGAGIAASAMPRAASGVARLTVRPRPGEAGWPSPGAWKALAGRLSGSIEKPRAALDAALSEGEGKVDDAVLAKLTNPFYLQDYSGSSQSSGWLDAWASAPSAVVGIPQNAQDVAALVSFARDHGLRVVIKGGGHSYFGQSTAPDSLLIWTRDLRGIDLHDRFVSQGADPGEGQPAVSVASGEKFIDLYRKAVVEGGRYVQGGGCTSVGVGGHAQAGGFGHFSKYGGMTGANLLEAEIVTAQGAILTANAYRNSDLFWALKGGGAGFGVTTRLTFATRDLPETFGFIGFSIKATDEAAYRRLIGRFLDLARERLINPHWGEQVHFAPDFEMIVKMTAQGLSANDMRDVWGPILAMAGTAGYDFGEEPVLYAIPAQRWWDLDYRRAQMPETIVLDDASSHKGARFFWNGDNGETNVFWGGYESAWLSMGLLDDARIGSLRDAIVDAASQMRFGFHFQKGLAGAPAERLAEARDTPVHPSAIDAFALLLVAAGQQNVIAGAPGHALDEAALRAKAARVRAVYRRFRAIEPDTGSYSAEMSFHEADWREKAWGRENYARLLAIKNRHDPAGLFTGHHQVGSEYWSADGFTRIG